jgi:hypothetical protein
VARNEKYDHIPLVLAMGYLIFHGPTIDPLDLPLTLGSTWAKWRLVNRWNESMPPAAKSPEDARKMAEE